MSMDTEDLVDDWSEDSASDSKQSPGQASLPCPNCGKDLGTNAITGKPLCPYCGYSLPSTPKKSSVVLNTPPSADLLEILEEFDYQTHRDPNAKDKALAALQTVMLEVIGEDYDREQIRLGRMRAIKEGRLEDVPKFDKAEQLAIEVNYVKGCQREALSLKLNGADTSSPEEAL